MSRSINYSIMTCPIFDCYHLSCAQIIQQGATTAGTMPYPTSNPATFPAT